MSVETKAVMMGPQVARLANITDFTIRNWRRAKYLKARMLSRGRYSAVAALEVLLAAKIVALKVPIGFAAEIVPRAAQAKGVGAIVFVNDDATQVVATDNPERDALKVFDDNPSVCALIYLPVRSSRRKIEAACAADWGTP